MKKNIKSKGYKIAAYVRVSTEEQAANPEGSVKNQEQRIREYVRHRNLDLPFGEIIEVFCDPGISAKNMNRPSLQRMLTQVQMGLIDLVIVSDLSRLTRSTKDFALLWDFLRDQGCKFQSLREAFDTTTAAGEMIMFTLANFAQFERKQTGERIVHSFLARSKRGLYNGGSVPLGYRIDDTKPGHLAVVEDEAEIVRLVFKTYLETQTIAQTAKRLNDMKVKFPRTPRGSGTPRGKFFRMSMIHGILKQKAYLGIRVYKVGDHQEETKAVWPAIVDADIFSRVQEMLTANKHRKKPMTPNRYPFLISGLCFCEKCGDRMTGKTATGNGGKFAYYEHAWQTKANANLLEKAFHCTPARVQVDRIEPVVWREVKRFLADSNMAKELLEHARQSWIKAQSESPEIRIKKKISSIKGQTEALAERIGKLPADFDASVLISELSKLQGIKKEYESQLEDLKNEKPVFEEPLSVKDFEDFRPQLISLVESIHVSETKAQLIAKVVQKVHIFDNGIEIFFHVGGSHYKNELGGSKSSDASFPNVVGSNSLTFGAGDGKSVTR